MLDDVGEDDIDPQAPLFGDGLGLDSIDALELAIAIHKRFGVKLEPDDDANKRIFASLRALAQHIDKQVGDKQVGDKQVNQVALP